MNRRFGPYLGLWPAPGLPLFRYRGRKRFDRGPCPAMNAAIAQAELAGKQVDQPPYPCHDDVIFVALDSERHCMPERVRRNILRTDSSLTEAGIAFLDTRHLAGIPPLGRGHNWFQHGWYYHMRVQDNLHLTGACEHHQRGSGRHKGHAEAFMFEASEWTTLRDFACDFNARLDEWSIDYENPGAPPRKMVLLLFDDRIAKGVAKEFNLNLFGRANIVRTIDMQRHDLLGGHIQRAYDSLLLKPPIRVGKWRDLSLQEYCSAVGLPTTELDNAGNDAAFMLQAFIATVFIPARDYFNVHIRGTVYPLPPSWYGGASEENPPLPCRAGVLPRRFRSLYKFLTDEQKKRFGYKLEPAARQNYRCAQNRQPAKVQEPVRYTVVGRQHGRV